MKIIEVAPEFLGTFALIFSILATGNFLVIGLTLALVIYLVGDLSGANVNPVVSLIFYINNQIFLLDCFLIYQCFIYFLLWVYIQSAFVLIFIILSNQCH
jgi:glycerol uptake facilitator-like aquaporin